MIEVKNISKAFGDVKAVEDLSFMLDRGEVVGMLGPNGAGKTTTMRIMTGYLNPDSGEVTVNGTSVKKNASIALKSLGYLPENNPLYSEMLVSEFLNYSADLKGVKKEKKQEALDFAINSTSIDRVYYRPIRELSKGYKQRVGIAAALVHNPQILILDEPTEGLDPTQRIEIRDLVRSLAKDHTVLISTHVLQEAEAMCTRLLMLSRGKKVADGKISDIKRENLGKKQVYFDAEGKGVKEKLHKLVAEEDVSLEEISTDRVRAELLVQTDSDIQSKLFELAKENNWKVREISEKERSLEEVFEQLTR